MLDKQRLRTFLLGGVAGALAGIIFAPKSGKELRGSITARAGEARERGRETYFEAQERMQERIAETRGRSPRRGDIRVEEVTPDSLPKLRTVTSKPTPPIETPAEAPSDPTPLRDVSWKAPQPEFGEEPDPEEIKRRVQETRSRLQRARLDTPGPEEAHENHDE